MTINHPSFSTSFDIGPAIGLDVDTVVDSATMHRALLACGWDDPEPDFVDACVDSATMHRALLACGWDDPEPDFVDACVGAATMHRALLACGWDDPEPDFVDACVGAAERGVDALAEVVVGNASLGEARETAEE